MLRDLVVGNRSVRRFEEGEAVSEETLRSLVDLARLSPSGANLQALKYVLAWEPERNVRIFPHLAWAGYLTDWPGPEAGERPAAYIVILGDREISDGFGCDHTWTRDLYFILDDVNDRGRGRIGEVADVDKEINPTDEVFSNLCR